MKLCYSQWWVLPRKVI